ncbi:hypothetical protein Tco_0753664, partial [Tanacetum coccineum]
MEVDGDVNDGELSSECAIMDSVVVAISFPNGSGNFLETLDVEYKLRPPRCTKCKIFDHEDDFYPSRDKKVAPTSSLGNGCVRDVANQVDTNQPNDTPPVNKDGANKAGDHPHESPEASMDVSPRDKDKSTYFKNNILILFGVIPAIIPVIPEVPAKVPIVPDDPLFALEVGAVYVTSPTGVLDLVDYSSSDSDPLDIPYLQHQSYHWWRDRVTSRPSSPSGSSSHDTFAPSSEFLIAPIVSPLEICRRPAIFIRPGEAISFVRPYRTHSNRPRKLLTARKRVGPFPARILAWRRISHRSLDCHSSPDFTSDSSSSGSSSDCQTHSGPSTRVASSRLVYPSVMTPQYSEDFSRWRSASFSTPYPPTTSESSPYSSSERSLDSSSLSARPSRKRCKSPTTSVPLSTLVSRSIAPTHADLLPPRKRFRGSYSLEDSREEHMEIGTVDAEAIADLGIGDEVGAHIEDGISMVIEITARDVIETAAEEEVESSARGMVEVEVDPKIGPVVDEDVPDHVTTDGAVEVTYETLRDLVHRFHDHTEEIPVHRIQVIETAQRQLMASEEITGLADRIIRLGQENLKVRAL